METLKLNQIAPYASYGLKGYFNGEYDIVTELDFDHGIISSMNNGNCFLNHFQPIFHPLSDLTKPISINAGEKFVPKEKLFEKWVDRYSYTYTHIKPKKTAKTDFDLIFNNVYNKKGYDYLEHWMYQDLIKWKFDVFQLIPEDLVIDINTL